MTKDFGATCVGEGGEAGDFGCDFVGSEACHLRCRCEIPSALLHRQNDVFAALTLIIIFDASIMHCVKTSLPLCCN